MAISFDDYRRRRTDLTRCPLILNDGLSGSLWMYAGEHPEECRLVLLWPGDYLTADGVRFPPMVAWDGEVGGFLADD